jgi:cytochrome P450
MSEAAEAGRGEPASVGRSEVDEARNRSFGAGLVDDPYPTYHRLLRECPVHAGGIAQHFGVTNAIEATGDSLFTVHSFRECVDILKSDTSFTNQWYEPSLNVMIGPNMLGMDEPQHKRFRLLVQRAFSKREMRWWRSDIVEPIVKRQLDPLVARGRGDLYSDFAAFVPARVIVTALGLPESDLDQFVEWAIIMTSMAETAEDRASATQAMSDYVRPLCDERRRNPGRDLISILVEATLTDEEVAEDGGLERHPLTDDEIDGFVKLLLLGGASTTYRAFGMLLYMLFTHPDQLADVRADRTLVENAIEELLRLEQPLVQVGRRVARDTVLRDVAIPRGATVLLNLGAANHDPDEWPEPDEFDIHRKNPDRHLTFGFGKHHCLGVHLARMELDVMVNEVLDRLPNLRLDPTVEDIHLTGLGFRMVTKLPCLWNT